MEVKEVSIVQYTCNPTTSIYLQYAILMMIVFTVLVKYLLHCIDLYDENPWENKAVYLLYLELLTSK